MLLVGLLLYKLSHKKSAYKILARRMIKTSMSVLFIIGFTNISDWALWPLESRLDDFRNKTAEAPYSGIIVLGGSENLTESTASGQATLNHGAERLIETAALARKFPSLPIIHSGGTRFAEDQLSENDVAKLFFDQAGINLSRIRFDDKAYNTHTNATESKKLIKTDETGTWLLVTSAFHMPRSVGAFQQAGINFQSYPVDYKTTLKYDGIFDIGFSKNLTRFDLAIHEYVGLLAYYITDRSSSLYPEMED